MDKERYFDNKGILAQNSKFILRRLGPEDKEAYLNLYKENSVVAKAMATEETEYMEKYVWNQIAKEEAIYVSIISKDMGNYLGNIVLRDLSSRTPEIGIEILKQFQRQGIAFDTLKLFMRKVARICPIDYYFVRIYSDNQQSQGLFHKLGAVQIGSEPSECQAFIDNLKKTMGEQEYDELMRKHSDVEEIAGQHYIAHYKLDYISAGRK